MSPPSFSDIGKSARDLIKKNFVLGISFVSFKGLHAAGEFTSRIDNISLAKKVVSSFESKYTFKEWNLSVTEKWTSKDTISAEASLDDKPVDGLKNTIKVLYDTKSGSTWTSLKSVLKRDIAHATVDFNLQKTFPDISPSLVLCYQDYLIGVDMAINTENIKLNRANFAIAYAVNDFSFHGIISNWAQTYTAGIYQRLSDRSEYAVEATWSRKHPDYHWAVAGQYALDEAKRHNLKVKLDDLHRFTISLNCKLMHGVKATLCALLNDADQTQVGFGVEIER